MKWFLRKITAPLLRFARLPKKVTIPIAIVVLGILSMGAYKAVDTYSYMQNDPTFCRACHVMEEAWDRWSTSEHSEVNCHSCHEVSIFKGLEQLIQFSLGRPERVSKHAFVPDEACDECHESGDPKWIQIAAEAGHRVHAEEQNIACTKCHSVALHRFEPPKPICAVCHEEKEMEVAEMGELHCLACHDYLNESRPLLPHREPCLTCHETQAQSEITWPADAPMQYDCRECHQPHEQAEPVVDCLSCHSDVPSKGLHASSVHSVVECQTCHQPHQWEVKERDDCVSCHADKAEHNAGLLCNTCHSFE